MIKSMTGYGRGEFSDGRRKVTAEIRSVNHRYCDINVHMPRKYSFSEDAVKNEVKKTVKRGKIDVNISIEDTGGADVDIQLNQEIAGKYLEKLEELSKLKGVEGSVSLEYLASLPDVMKMVPSAENEEEIIAAFVNAVASACAAHDAMRIAEGNNLSRDLLMRGGLIAGCVDIVEERSPKVITEHYDRIREHMEELLSDAAINEERLLQEAAVFADKINVTEEMVRLRSHIHQMEQFLEGSDGPIGKKLDFLVQEMNREANTIGSKANDIEITRQVLEIKGEIEKIREQVQNIE